MQSWYCGRYLRDGNGQCLFRGTRPKGPDWTVSLINPDSFSEDLICVLLIRVQKEISERSCFHTDK